MPRGRAIAWTLTLGAAAVFAVSIVPMAKRIAAFNAGADLQALHAEEIFARAIKVEGFPEGGLTDEPPPPDAPPGIASVRLDYGGVTVHIPVKKPPAPDIPNLSGYDEWLRVLAVYEVVRGEDGRQYRKDGSERLVIVVRRTPEGYDPEAEGEVRRIEWVFDFYDLKRDGSVLKYTRRWPRSYRAEKRLHDQAENKDGKVDPRVVASARALLGYGPLKERSFDYFVAMHVIPKLNVPEYKFNDTAFSFQVLGWTLPAAMGSVLVFCGGLVFAVAPRKTGLANPGGAGH